jgi:uncharacterized repeat protein (TIGR04076 family)
MEIFDLRVTVDSIGGRSVCGLKPGDYFEVTNSAELRIPEGKHFCMYANCICSSIASSKTAEDGIG